MHHQDRKTRFETCLHEAGHLATARHLNGWRTTCAATIRDDAHGGGYATLPKGLTPFSEAVATCAGDYAGRLNIEPPERRRKKPLPPPDTPEGIRARAIEATRPAAVAEVHCRTCRAGNDADHVARFCVSMHPENPDEWKAAFERVHREAAALVSELRCEIHKLAIRLFHDSEITIPGDPGHDEYFAGTVASE